MYCLKFIILLQMQANKRSSRRGTFLSQDDQRIKTQKQYPYENTGKNVLYRVLSPKHTVTEQSSYPTKFSMKIKKDKSKPQINPPNIQQLNWQRQRDFYQRQIRNLKEKIIELSHVAENDKKQLIDKQNKINKINLLLQQYQQCNEGLVKQSEENIKKFEQYMKDSNNQKDRQIYQLNLQINDLKKQLKDKNNIISQYYRQIQKIKDENRRFQQQLLDTAGKYYSSPPKHKAIVDMIQIQSKNQTQNHKFQQQMSKMEATLAQKQKYIIKLSEFNNELVEKMLKQRNQMFETSSANMNQILGVLKNNNQQRSKFRRVKSEANILIQNQQPQNMMNQNQLYYLKHQINSLNEQLSQKNKQTKFLKQKKQFMYQLLQQKQAKIQELTYLLQRNNVRNSSGIHQSRNYAHLQQTIRFKDKLMEGLSAENQQLKIELKKANERKSEAMQFSTNQSYNITLQTEKSKTLVLKDALDAQESLNKALRQRIKTLQNKGNGNFGLFSFKYQTIQNKIQWLNTMYKQLNTQLYECSIQILDKKNNLILSKQSKFSEIDNDLIGTILIITKSQTAFSENLQRQILQKLESGMMFKSKSTSKLGFSNHDFDTKYSYQYQNEEKKKNQRSVTALNSIYITNSQAYISKSRMKEDVI